MPDFALRKLSYEFLSLIFTLAGIRSPGASSRDGKDGGVFKDGKGVAILGANAKGANRGLDRDRKDTGLSLVSGVRTNPEANLARMVDCRGSNFRTNGHDRSGGRSDRAVQECSGDSVRTSSGKRDAGQVDRTMRSTGGGCDEEGVSDRGVDNELSVQRQQKGSACVQQDGAGKERLGISGDEG